MGEMREVAEEERIAKWRAERQAVAERERQERIRQRQEEARAAELRRQKEAARLLPDPREIEEERARLLRRARLRRGRTLVAFAVFVVLPTLLITLYMARIATPLFEARSVTAISSAAPQEQAGNSGIFTGGLAAGPSLEKTFMAHEYLQSRALLTKLEDDTGFVTRLSGPQMDPLRRARSYPVLGLDRLDMMARFLRAAVDIQSGLLTVNVSDVSPEQARITSDQVLVLLGQHINALSQELFARRVAQSETAAADARRELLQAQRALTQLQIDSGEADPRTRVDAIYASVGQLRTEVEETRSKIATLEVANRSQNYAVGRLRELESRLTQRITDLRRQLFESANDTSPLNALLLEHELATLRVEIAQETLSGAIAALSQARKEAELGRSQFQIVVPPRTAAVATDPNLLRIALLCFVTLATAFGVAKLLRAGRVD
ncbi:MAG: hypothetical protein CML55_03195 [Rhodobacteraceae bacterium]|nr:hypothetical protein [Paracoccaceae bacterium]MBO29291.1 hypothetical protein [Paracoccaceae bacterium]